MTRLRDLMVSGLGLLMLAPLFLVVALAIRLDSRGPVFFRQTRVGRRGRHFRIHKFRTMRVDAVGPAVSTTEDPRVTRFGRFLRSSKIDELPQLIDVLHGEMSLVGPRPEVPQYVDLWPPHLRPLILSIRPGLTDPASIALRHEGQYLSNTPDPEATYVESLLPKKAGIYADYVLHRSQLGDLAIILKTFIAILRPAGKENESARSHSQ